MATRKETDADEQRDNPLLELPPDRQEELIAAYERFEDSDAADDPEVNRRGVLAGIATLITGSAIGGSAYALSTEEVAAATAAVGQVGEPGNLVDVYGEDISAVSVNADDMELSQLDWGIRSAAQNGSGGDGSKSNAFTSGLQTTIDNMQTDLGSASKTVILNAYFQEGLTLPTGNYRIDSFGTQTTRIMAPDSGVHALDDGGGKGLLVQDLWIDSKDTTGNWDVFNLTGGEIFLNRLDIEGNATGVRNLVRATGVTEFKMHNCHLQGSVASPNSVRIESQGSRIQIANVDDTTGKTFAIIANSSQDVTRLSMVNCDLDGDLNINASGANPSNNTVANVTVGGDAILQGENIVYSGLVARSGQIKFAGGGNNQYVTGVSEGATGSGVEFTDSVSNCYFQGLVRSPSGTSVNFDSATECVYAGPVDNGITYGSGQTDCDVWPTTPFGGSVAVAGTRPRFKGVIGGGPIGGVDLSTTTGQYVGDRAVADGTSTATAGALARWDGASWQFHDATGTV